MSRLTVRQRREIWAAKRLALWARHCALSCAFCQRPVVPGHLLMVCADGALRRYCDAACQASAAEREAFQLRPVS